MMKHLITFPTGELSEFPSETSHIFHQKICRSSLQGVPCNRPRGTCNFIHPRFQRDGNGGGREFSNKNHFLGGRTAPSPWNQEPPSVHSQHQQPQVNQPPQPQPPPPQVHQVDVTAIATEVVKIIQRMNLGMNGERGGNWPPLQP